MAVFLLEIRRALFFKGEWYSSSGSSSPTLLASLVLSNPGLVSRFKADALYRLVFCFAISVLVFSISMPNFSWLYSIV